MDWKNPFRKGPKALDGPAGENEASDASPLGDAIVECCDGENLRQDKGGLLPPNI